MERARSGFGAGNAGAKWSHLTGMENGEMNWLLEEPFLIVFVTVVAVAILLGALIQTGRPSALAAIVAVFALCGAALIVERVVVTDREAVVATLGQIARDLEQNNPSVVAAHIASTAPDLQQTTQSRLARVMIKKADVKGKPEVTIYSQGNVRFAEADLKGLVVGDDQKGFVQDFKYFRRFLVRFRHEDGAWKVYEYEEESPL